MKSIIIGLFLVCIAGIQTTAQDIFKGKVTYTLKTEDADFPMIITTNGSKFKVSMSMEMGSMDMIMDKTAKEQTMILHSQKMYMQLTAARLEKMKGMMGSMGKGLQAPVITEPVRTGETKKILNYICEKIVDKQEDITTEIWVTDKIGYLAFIGSPIVPMPSLANSDAATFFPLEVHSKDKDGETIMQLIAKEVSTSMPGDVEFIIPSDYAPFAFPGSGN